ncbi:MAG: type II toxin-antitoxin system Phd/YefM family antitoxin [Deltaproteobacteria bacterium]|nr:type II toxin-antitoxin system Phd/YefM family antitoxin [Deltaproteobacteria bacterium]
MKVVPLSEAKARLSRYGQLCHDEPVVVTVNGRPSFQLVPLEEEDGLIDRLIEEHLEFSKLLQRRLSDRIVSVEAASRRLAAARSRKRKARRG